MSKNKNLMNNNGIVMITTTSETVEAIQPPHHQFKYFYPSLQFFSKSTFSNLSR